MTKFKPKPFPTTNCRRTYVPWICWFCPLKGNCPYLVKRWKRYSR